MIGNEMNRGLYHLELQAWDRARPSYERVLQLVDLTVGPRLAQTRRRALLRWPDLAAVPYPYYVPSVYAHVEAFSCLLRMTPASARQIAALPYLIPHRSARPAAAKLRTVARSVHPFAAPVSDAVSVTVPASASGTV